jgi:archaeosine synthase beta-subunit
MESGSLSGFVSSVWDTSGARRTMGTGADSRTSCHYHLVRKFKSEVDLAIILNSRPCRYRCTFCRLSAKAAASTWTSAGILQQMRGVIEHYGDVLDVLDRVTVANEGSVLDDETLDSETLLEIVSGLAAIPSISRIVLETRPEFVTQRRVDEIVKSGRSKIVDFLIGFETLDDRIRNEVLGKCQRREQLIDVIELLSDSPSTALTSYVLIKPDPKQTDREAVEEAQRTISFLVEHCRRKGVSLCVRLNPMYVCEETPWGRKARAVGYRPPRLSDVLDIAIWAEMQGVPAYVGLSSEGLASEESSFRSREDYGPALLKRVIAFNANRPALS